MNKNIVKPKGEITMKKYKFEMIATECLQIEVEADSYIKAKKIAGQSCFEEDWETTDWIGGSICSVDLPEGSKESLNQKEK
tara:strand:- start:27 stop:269 length:243 start_codon:yes stop_codon:yes gene_type:complete